MKKFGMMMAAIIAVMSGSGCSTALMTNTAEYEKKTEIDGTITEKRKAHNSVKALGDRAVEQNLKGSLADATDEDLSAGIRESSQKSESGAIVELIKVGINKLGDLGVAYLGGRAQKEDAGSSGSSGGAGGSGASSSSSGASGMVAASYEIRTVQGAEGSPSIVILGNKASAGGCGLCKSLDKKLDYSEMSSDFCAASIIDADMTSNNAVFKKYAPAGRFKFPYVRVYDGDGVLKGEFEARGALASQAAILAKAEAFIPSCTVIP